MSVRADGSVRKVVRVREGWAPQQREKRSVAALARAADVAAKKRLESLPPARLTSEQGSVAGWRALEEGLFEREDDDDDASLVAWFASHVLEHGKAELTFAGRSVDERRELYAVVDGLEGIAASSNGFGHERTMRILSNHAHVVVQLDDAQLAVVDRLWRCYQSARDNGESRSLSRGELSAAVSEGKRLEWLEELDVAEGLRLTRCRELAGAVAMGDVQNVRAIIDQDRGALFAAAQEPLVIIAIEKGHLQCLEVLLKAGATPLCFSKKGAGHMSSREIAERLGRNDMLDLLDEAAAGTTSLGRPYTRGQ